MGWPIDHKTFSGSFMYHYGKNIVSVGMCIGLDYKNPYLNPYMEFQVSIFFIKFIIKRDGNIIQIINIYLKKVNVFHMEQEHYVQEDYMQFHAFHIKVVLLLVILQDF